MWCGRARVRIVVTGQLLRLGVGSDWINHKGSRRALSALGWLGGRSQGANMAWPEELLTER